MTRHLLFIIAFLVCLCSSSRAATKPTVSDEGHAYWYFIKFSNSGNVITSKGDGAMVQAEGMTAQKGELWRLDGSLDDGFTLTNQLGLRLYCTTTSKNGMAYASSTHDATKFRLKQLSSGDFEITPYANAAVALNQWGGPNAGRGIGLWDTGDSNNPLAFVSDSILTASQNQPSIIPYPQKIEVKDGARLALNQLTYMAYLDETSKRYADDFTQQLLATSGISLQVVAAGADGQHGIDVTKVDTLGSEAYNMLIDDAGIHLYCSTDTGYFYALQTLKQLLPNAFFAGVKADADWSVPQLSIEDAPAMGYRGLMVDISRHFFGKAEIKRLLDVMAFYKMNRFHWHLTDDQGWRIEIPEYPLLTKVGAVRDRSLVTRGTGTNFYDDTPYGKGMYYTLDDLREIVAYASERNIQIIPEVDLPGHMVSVLAAYPNLSCDSTKTYQVRVDAGISQDVLNIGDDRAIDFLKCVLGHIAEVFPGDLIHIGGDECPTTVWQKNQQCLDRVKNEGLAGVNELQSWLVEKLGEFLKEKYNKDIVVWDELLDHWRSTNQVKPVIMGWRTLQASANAAKKGFRTIVVPYDVLYLDFMQQPQNACNVTEGYYGGWGDGYYNTLPEIYSYNPMGTLKGYEQLGLGVQGNMWTETCNDSTELEYQLFPRALAISEIGWLQNSKKDWISFFTRLQRHGDLLEMRHLNYAPHYFTAKGDSLSQAQNVARDLLAQTKPGEAGYVSQAAYDALKTALATATTAADLQTAINAFKADTIVQPSDTALYHIVSASTYYKLRFVGSTLYEKNGIGRVHYTEQDEPEELWRFERDGDNWTLVNATSGNRLSMATYNQNTTLGQSHTALRVDKAQVANAQYDYVPGAVTISAVNGYQATSTGSVKRLYAAASGNAIAYDDPTLCYPGTWTLQRIDDFTAQLRKLLAKCNGFVEDYTPGVVGSRTPEAMTYLQDSVIALIQTTLGAQTVVSEVQYMECVNRYKTFLAMPTLSALDMLDENGWYKIRNGYFTSYYAQANGDKVVHGASSTAEAQLWRFEKTAEGVRIHNKVGDKTAYVASNTAEAKVQLGTDYNWTLSEITTDQGQTGLTIRDVTGQYSWYINPSVWTEVLLKPYDWGASIWSLEKQDVSSGIENVKTRQTDAPVRYYNTMGQRVSRNTPGIVIDSNGRKIQNR